MPNSTSTQEDIQRIQDLESDAWFASLPQQLKTQLGTLKTRHYRDGELIHARGEQPTGLFGVLSGRARVCTVSANGKELLLTILEAGNWFGITSVLDGLPHTHDVYAHGESELLRMPRQNFNRLLQQHPEYGLDFARWMAIQIRRVFEGVEDSSLLSFDALLAKRILNLASVHQASTDSATPSSDVKIPLSQSELANLLATTRQSVSKQLKRWEAEGYISTHYGYVVLHQPEVLAAISRQALKRT